MANDYKFEKNQKLNKKHAKSNTTGTNIHTIVNKSQTSTHTMQMFKIKA